MKLDSWIRENTQNSAVVVDFGSMFFDKLGHVSSLVRKIGIEIWKEYIDRASFHDCQKILGDFTHFEELINHSDMDCAMFIDSLEHLDKPTAMNLITRVQSQFNKILLMIPEGHHSQTTDYFNLGADKYQTHRSTWYEEDIRALGFQEIIVDPVFHSGDPSKDAGCIFAIWRKE